MQKYEVKKRQTIVHLIYLKTVSSHLKWKAAIVAQYIAIIKHTCQGSTATKVYEIELMLILHQRTFSLTIRLLEFFHFYQQSESI
jgi:hypothetical protein